MVKFVNGLPRYVYCVVKSATIKKKDGSVICTIPFANPFKVISDMSDQWYGEAYKPTGKQEYIKYRGFVKKSGFSIDRVVDMAYLKYRNITGKKIPTAMRYKGQATGFIGKNEVIHVIASAGDWMLTGKGWTKAEWLQKERDICDYESMRTLVYAVITQTVKDYTKIVHKLQKNGRYVTGEFTDAIAELKLIRKWFKDGDYLKIIDDDCTGEERLQMLDKQLGVTDEWIKEITAKRKKRSL